MLDKMRLTKGYYSVNEMLYIEFLKSKMSIIEYDRK
jgi:hypothetical protein